jgi:hypothetical protein
LIAACGGGGPAKAPHAKEPATTAPETPYSITTVKEETPPNVDPFRASAGPGNASVPYVRDERSSRLDVDLPRGRAREAWHVSHEVSGAVSVVAAGNRVGVIGAERWALFDGDGRRAGAGKVEGGVRLDRASGEMGADDMRGADLPAGAKVAARNGLSVMVSEGNVSIGERAIEGRFEALDVAIDESGVACVIVRQANELSLWTIPTASKGGIGRHRLGRGRRSIGPPILGRSLRVVVLDTGIVAFALDGKRLWERRGVPSGGASITPDDHLLVADGGKIVTIDPRGRATELATLPGVVFTTPPILNARGVLFAASADALYALTFS